MQWVLTFSVKRHREGRETVYAEANGGSAREQRKLAEVMAEAAAEPASEEKLQHFGGTLLTKRQNQMTFTKIAECGKVYQGKLNDEGFHVADAKYDCPSN